MDGEVRLGCPELIRVGAQRVADDLLESANARLGASPLRVTGGFLPSRASVLGITLQMTAALRECRLGSLVISTRRYV